LTNISFIHPPHFVQNQNSPDFVIPQGVCQLHGTGSSDVLLARPHIVLKPSRQFNEFLLSEPLDLEIVAGGVHASLLPMSDE
jgi:hypothetical protein